MCVCVCVCVCLSVFEFFDHFEFFGISPKSLSLVTITIGVADFKETGLVLFMLRLAYLDLAFLFGMPVLSEHLLQCLLFPLLGTGIGSPQCCLNSSSGDILLVHGWRN